jgi:hypothetical protein
MICNAVRPHIARELRFISLPGPETLCYRIIGPGGDTEMIFALAVIRTTLRPINAELQVTCLWAAAGLAVFGVMVSLGFGVEIGQCLALE